MSFGFVGVLRHFVRLSGFSFRGSLSGRSQLCAGLNKQLLSLSSFFVCVYAHLCVSMRMCVRVCVYAWMCVYETVVSTIVNSICSRSQTAAGYMVQGQIEPIISNTKLPKLNSITTHLRSFVIAS